MSHFTGQGHLPATTSRHTNDNIFVAEYYNLPSVRSEAMTLDYVVYYIAVGLFCAWWFQWLIHITAIVYAWVHFSTLHLFKSSFLQFFIFSLIPFFHILTSYPIIFRFLAVFNLSNFEFSISFFILKFSNIFKLKFQVYFTNVLNLFFSQSQC